MLARSLSLSCSQCLRQFQDFLERKDKKRCWARMSRMLLPEGRSVWVCPKCFAICQENAEASYEDLRAMVTKDLPKDEDGQPIE